MTMDLSSWELRYNNYRNRGDKRGLESELKRAADDLRVAANEQQRKTASARIRLLNNHIRNVNLGPVVGRVNREGIRQPKAQFGRDKIPAPPKALPASPSPQPRPNTGGVGTRVAGTQVRSGSPAVVPGASGVMGEAARGANAGRSRPSGGPIALREPNAVAVQGSNTGPSAGGALVRRIPGGPVAVPSAGGTTALSRVGKAVAAGADDVIDAEVIREVAKKGGRLPGWAKLAGVGALTAGAAYLGRELGPRKEEKFVPDVAPVATKKPEGATNAYPAQSPMSQKMGVAKDSTGQIDKMNLADVKKAEGYMTDLMQRIGKGGWDQPGTERRGTQVGQAGSDKIVQMFNRSDYSDQFTRAEKEEAIKRFQANFAKQKFAGRNVTPAGRTVTPTAQYKGSPERY